MVAAVLADHYGLMGLTPEPMAWQRWVDVALVLGGVFLIQGAGAQAPVSSQGLDWTPGR